MADFVFPVYAGQYDTVNDTTYSSMWPSQTEPSGALNYSKKFDVLLNMIKNVGETGGTFIIEHVWIDEDGRHQTSSHVVTAKEVQTKPIIQPQHS